MQIFNKYLLKSFETAEAKNTKFKPKLRQIGSEGHAKYGYAAPNMNQEIFKNNWLSIKSIPSFSELQLFPNTDFLYRLVEIYYSCTQLCI